MKIDLHCHTRKVKSGDAPTREVGCSKFVDSLENSQVSIAAITNHNLFDYDQYKEFKEACDAKHIQLWPGIELDVEGKKSKGHCIIIANPKEVLKFNNCCNLLLNNINPDKFIISIEGLLEGFKDLDVIVIAHYGRKKPSLVQEDLDFLKNSLPKGNPLFLEVSQLRSAGILYAHSLNSFIGSDVHDWDKYSETELPELKMPINDYEHFNLLVKKDPQVLKTFMDAKISEIVEISPFSDCTEKIPIYNDTNIFFGGKGTGKSSFLKELKKHFESFGNSDVVYYGGQTKESDYKKMITITNEDEDFDKLGIPDCEENFKKITEWRDVSIATLNKYVDWASTRDSNKLSANFGFKDESFNETISYNRYEEYLIDYDNLLSIKCEFEKIRYFDEYLDNIEYEKFINLFTKIINSSKTKTLDEWIKTKSLELEKYTIDKMKSICKIKSGVNQLPSSTGLLETFVNCTNLYSDAHTILSAMNSNSVVEKRKLGTLQEKGSIYLEKTIFINPDEKNLIYKKGSTYTVSDLRSLKELIQNIEKISYTFDKGSVVSSFISLIQNKNITSLKNFVGVKGGVINNKGQSYEPSNGEQSMLLLTNALVDDNKNVYILDEPELSVGHKYINDEIVPRIIELSKMNKTVIISTHDANIAVRTLPLLSVYREYKGNNQYATYIGDPFFNKLINTIDDSDILDWTERSIDTLEGGEVAFVERGEIYGK